MRHAGEGIALLNANVIRNVFIAPRKRNGLKRNRLHFIDVLRRKLDNRADAIVVDRINDRRYQRYLNADGRKIFNRLLLYIKQVANPAMSVLLFADAIEL